MSFKINSLYLTDGYKVGHKAMLAPEQLNCMAPGFQEVQNMLLMVLKKLFLLDNN